MAESAMEHAVQKRHVGMSESIAGIDTLQHTHTRKEHMSDKPNMMALTQEVLDIEELENRLELAAQTAECGCCGSNGNNCDCNTKVVAKGVSPAVAPTC